MRGAVGEAHLFASMIKAPIPYHRLCIDPSCDTAGFPNHQLARDRIGLTAGVVVPQPSHGLLVLGQEWPAQGFLIFALWGGDVGGVPVMDTHISRWVIGVTA